MRKKLLTNEILAQIPRWVRQEQLTAADIARKIGCTVGTLRVRCSQLGISLTPAPKALSRERRLHQAKSVRQPRCQLKFLPSEVRDQLRARAALRGVSELTLLASLIEAIDRDDLYGAVLDERADLDKAKV
jgi:transposase-like protein